MTTHTHAHTVSLVNGASQAEVKRGARVVVNVKGINGATSGATSLIQNEMFRHVLLPVMVAPGPVSP